MAHYWFFFFDITPLPFSCGVSFVCYVWEWWLMLKEAESTTPRRIHLTSSPEWLFLQLHQWLSIHACCTDMDCIISWHCWHFWCHKVGVCVCVFVSVTLKKKTPIFLTYFFFLFLPLVFIFICLLIVLSVIVIKTMGEKLLGKRNKLNSAS